MASETDSKATWERLRRAIDGESLPIAVLDLDAFEANVDALMAPARAAKKTIRVATKSVRSIDLLRAIATRAGDAAQGWMTFAARETRVLAEAGFRDLLLAYPTALRVDADALVAAEQRCESVAVVADAREQLEVLDAAAAAGGRAMRVLVDVDAAYRPFGGALHLGVRRSPLRTPDEIVAFAHTIDTFEHLRFHGWMAYEAQIAGVPDAAPFGAALNPARRAMRSRARAAVESQRAKIADALTGAGLASHVVNGGGTGSLAWSCADPTLTEVTVGSGFLDSHLFDYYRGLVLRPAALFALQVVRRPTKQLVTCHGGGYIASGTPGPDRLPLPWLPAGLALLGLEGAGEVQTPLTVPEGVDLPLGAPVFFRHAKAGELAEHFNEYVCVRGERVVSRAKTYRGEGHAFLG